MYLTKHHSMKTYGLVEVQLHTFLTSALDGGKWPLYSLGKSHRYTLVWRLGGPQNRPGWWFRI